MAKFTERVFSGVQPTGNLHLGNYLGALKRFVEMQATHPCIYCVVDLHAMTMPHDPEALARATREVTATFLACGIDPVRNIVFNQSRVNEHAELAWVLDCVARIGWLNRMTQFKEKAGKDRENASVGLYNYPVLMAADILVYQATHVPVGDDQKQHLELARDIAQKFNNDFSAAIAAHGHGDALFPLPEPLIQGPATRVMSLRDGSKKMSKSDASEYSLIALTDDADAISQKIRRAKTDPDALPSEVEGLANRPGSRQSRRHFRRPQRRDQGAGVENLWRGAVLGLQGRACRVDDLETGADPRRNSPSQRRARACRSRVGGRGRARARNCAPCMNAVKDIVGLLR